MSLLEGVLSLCTTTTATTGGTTRHGWTADGLSSRRSLAQGSLFLCEHNPWPCLAPLFGSSNTPHKAHSLIPPSSQQCFLQIPRTKFLESCRSSQRRFSCVSLVYVQYTIDLFRHYFSISECTATQTPPPNTPYCPFGGKLPQILSTMVAIAMNA